MDTLTCSYSHTRITSGGQSYSLHDEVKAAGAIANIHIKGGGRCALFLIAVDVEALVMTATKEELFHCRRVAVEVDNYRTVGGEKGLKHLIVQTVGMGSVFL